MCDDEWDIYRELEELLYAEALRYYVASDLGRLREIEERAEKLGVDELLLERLAGLRRELEERLLREMSGRVSQAAGAAV